MKQITKLEDIAISLPTDYGDAPQEGCENIDVVKVSNINSEGRFHRVFEKRKFPIKKLSKLLVEEGELLVVKSSGSKTNILSGKTAFCDNSVAGKLIASNFLIRLSIDESKAYPKYLWHVLNSKFSKQFIRKIVGATTYPNLKWSTYRTHPIPLPSLDEQRRIAKILDTAINLQRKQTEINKSLLELEKNIFVEFFGDPLFNKKSLPLVPLEQLGKLDRGMSKHRPRNDPSLLGGPYPLIQTGDVANSSGLINSYHSTYSELGLKQSKLWKEGTLCITIAANIAKTGILKIDACFPDSVVGFTSEHPENIYYVRTWLSFLQKTLEQQAPESAQKNINLRLLRELKVPYPPLDQMKRFLVSIQSLEKLKLSAKKKAETLNLLVTSLSSNLLKEKVK